MTGAPLAGRRVVVTRAAEQSPALAVALEAAGAQVVEVPVIAIAEPVDGGAALADALADALDPSTSIDWIVITSPNGARRLVDALTGRTLGTTAVAVVGPATADVLVAAGVEVRLVPERFDADGLLAVFPAPPSPGRRVLLAQADRARTTLADGLRDRGWTVTSVVAYRTIAATPSPSALASAATADAITFASSSSVESYLTAAGAGAVPAVVACIGPVTARTATEAGLTGVVVATEHTIPGLVAAVVSALAG